MDHKITVLMPCRDQKKEFLVEAINSMLGQTSPSWNLFIIVDSDTPDTVKNIINPYQSRYFRIKMLISEEKSMAGALNTGMKYANTEFVCILLSDDLLDKKAVETLQRYIKKYPDIDFFHTARRYIDSKGRIRSKIMPSKDNFTLDYFKKYGSPMKHLLCWRREKGLAIGGMDKEVSIHGCDDYDFPWSMAEAGCRFKAIKECLYYYRIHHDFYRLTTHISIEKQTESLRRMFKKHGVAEAETESYLRAAEKTYLIRDKVLSFEKNVAYESMVSLYRTFKDQRLGEFILKGFKQRYFFPHRSYYLPKSGPEGLKLASRMCSINNPNDLWQINLYAERPVIDEFPSELFFDDNLNWHRQHLGKAGHIAYSCLAVRGNAVYGLNYVSDLVQRISRRREFKTRIENRFQGWSVMLLNSILNFARERGIRYVYSAGADMVIAHTDPSRTVKRDIFDDIYDKSILEHFNAKKDGAWWVLDVEKNKEKIVAPEKGWDPIDFGKTICVTHDIERDLGHTTAASRLIDLDTGTYSSMLNKMLEAEKEAGIRATYNVTGLLIGETRGRIEEGGHCLAFHSYDHRIDRLWLISKIWCKIGRMIQREGRDNQGRCLDQLEECRRIDYRINGYRPPRSELTWELSDKRLCYYNFEWLASSAYSLKTRVPIMRNRVVKIPILFDDFAMFRDKMSYEEWRERSLKAMKENYFVALGLHDCYVPFWLERYKEFLENIISLGQCKTLNEVANEIIFSYAE